jgi:hypothetical protein
MDGRVKPGHDEEGDNQKLISRFATASAASLIASVSVGWAWQVRARLCSR